MYNIYEEIGLFTFYRLQAEQNARQDAHGESNYLSHYYQDYCYLYPRQTHRNHIGYSLRNYLSDRAYLTPRGSTLVKQYSRYFRDDHRHKHKHNQESAITTLSISKVDYARQKHYQTQKYSNAINLDFIFKHTRKNGQLDRKYHERYTHKPRAMHLLQVETPREKRYKQAVFTPEYERKHLEQINHLSARKLTMKLNIVAQKNNQLPMTVHRYEYSRKPRISSREYCHEPTGSVGEFKECYPRLKLAGKSFKKSRKWKLSLPHASNSTQNVSFLDCTSTFGTPKTASSPQNPFQKVNTARAARTRFKKIHRNNQMLYLAKLTIEKLQVANLFEKKHSPKALRSFLSNS